MYIVDAGDRVINESHKYMDLTPVDGSSVNFFSFAVKALFTTPPRLIHLQENISLSA